MGVKIINNTIYTVKIVVYKKNYKNILFLITKEPEGDYNLPGGAQDITDDSLEETAQRELKEELGMNNNYKLVKSTITHEFIHSDKKSPRYGKKGILHIFLAEYIGNKDLKASDDLLAIHWMTEIEAIEVLKKSYSYLEPSFRKVLPMIK